MGSYPASSRGLFGGLHPWRYASGLFEGALTSRRPLRWSLALAGSAILAACATPRLHTVDELNRIGTTCGLSAGELVQEAELKKVVILYRVAPTPAERSCVYQWARRNHLHLAVIEAVDQSEK